VQDNYFISYYNNLNRLEPQNSSKVYHAQIRITTFMLKTGTKVHSGYNSRKKNNYNCITLLGILRVDSDACTATLMSQSIDIHVIKIIELVKVLNELFHIDRSWSFSDGMHGI
jgi:hypothetical protein